MKIKNDAVAFIVANDVLKKHVEMIMHEQVQSGDAVVIKADVNNIEQTGRALVDSGVGAIVARGGTYADLKRDIKSVPVIKIEVSVADILFSLDKAKREYKRIYLILHDSIFFDFDAWKSLLNIQMTVYRYVSVEELKNILNQLEYDDDTVAVGSGACAEILRNKKLNTIEILPRDATNINAYQNARTVISQIRREKSHIRLLESILYAVGDGVIIIDEEGMIAHFNRRSEELIGLERRKAVGRNIREIMDCSAFEDKLNIRPFKAEQAIITVNDKTISLKIDLFQINKDEAQFILTLADVTKIQELEQDIRKKLSRKGLVARYTFDDILTNNQGMKDLIKKANSLTKFEGSVLIFGESGTGKELFAQSIHNASLRKNGPFVAVNCAALTESLLESELFGYVAGAFTGAKKEGKAGLFELAHGGTIFLDEINSMPQSLQAKVLRVIEAKEVMRIGSDYVIPLDVRVIAATNEKIRNSVKEKTFRQDLYFRLNTFELRIPPLRERKEDIILLFKHYLGQYKGVDQKHIKLDQVFEETLLSHDWLGNVRELKSTALRYYAFDGDNHNNDILDVEKSGNEESIVGSDLKIDLNQLNKTVETLVIQSLLDKNIKKTEIARLLGISRQALFKKINKMNEENSEDTE